MNNQTENPNLDVFKIWKFDNIEYTKNFSNATCGTCALYKKNEDCSLHEHYHLLFPTPEKCFDGIGYNWKIFISKKHPDFVYLTMLSNIQNYVFKTKYKDKIPLFSFLDILSDFTKRIRTNIVDDLNKIQNYDIVDYEIPKTNFYFNYIIINIREYCVKNNIKRLELNNPDNKYIRGVAEIFSIMLKISKDKILNLIFDSKFKLNCDTFLSLDYKKFLVMDKKEISEKIVIFDSASNDNLILTINQCISYILDEKLSTKVSIDKYLNDITIFDFNIYLSSRFNIGFSEISNSFKINCFDFYSKIILMILKESETDVKVLQCEDCKSIYISPKSQCTCGSKSFIETHKANIEFAKNYNILKNK